MLVRPTGMHVRMTRGGLAVSGDLPYAEERYGSRALQRRYACDHKGVRQVRRKGRRGVWEGVQKFLKEAFLPHGYPESVSDDYLAYQIWDTFQAFCSSITGTLATLAILKGVGVGDKEATPLAATITWMLKDGTGHLGRILFAWFQGTDLDCNAKRWRLVADVLNDLATFLELLAPHFPYFFLLFICAASVSKAIVGTAGGATRAALVQHQARRDNMADVSAKDGSQETLVNLVALVVNLVLTPAVAGKTVLIWTLFAVFTCLHLFANYKAVSAVTMETLNQQRLHIVLNDFFSTGSISSPASVNAREPILGVSTTRKLSYSLGVPLSHVLESADDYKQAVENFQKGQKFILSKFHGKRKRASSQACQLRSAATWGRGWICTAMASTGAYLLNTVAVALHKDCSVRDQLKAAFVVETLDYITHHRGHTSQSPILSEYYDYIRDLEDARDSGSAIRVALSIVEDRYSSLLVNLELAGWLTSHHLLGVDEWRYSWLTEEEAGPDSGEFTMTS